MSSKRLSEGFPVSGGAPLLFLTRKSLAISLTPYRGHSGPSGPKSQNGLVWESGSRSLGFGVRVQSLFLSFFSFFPFFLPFLSFVASPFSFSCFPFSFPFFLSFLFLFSFPSCSFFLPFFLFVFIPSFGGLGSGVQPFSFFASPFLFPFGGGREEEGEGGGRREGGGGRREEGGGRREEGMREEGMREEGMREEGGGNEGMREGGGGGEEEGAEEGGKEGGREAGPYHTFFTIEEPRGSQVVIGKGLLGACLYIVFAGQAFSYGV